jgi:hypothetical protein
MSHLMKSQNVSSSFWGIVFETFFSFIFYFTPQVYIIWVDLHKF